MRRFIYTVALTLFIIMGVNVSIDPAHLIKSDSLQSDEAHIAEILLTKQQAFVPREKIGFDERIARKLFLEHKADADSSVIFGSSRVRYFSKKAFDDEHHFVDAVNAATLEDLVVNTYLRQKHKLLPKKMFIALDPWMIEKSNSYTRLAQVSYPESFVEAVEHFKFTLPEGSQRIYKNLAGNANDLLRIPFTESASSSRTAGDYRELLTGKSPLTSLVQVSFDGFITTGTYNWAWRIFVNGIQVDQGNYMDNLQGTPSPHQSRTVITKYVGIKEGDIVSLEMAHANNDGVVVPAGLQQYKAENFSIQLKCSNPVAEAHKSWTSCNNYLQSSHFRRYAIIAREMISPAYFQQSLKTLSPARGGSSAPGIEAKPDCTPDANDGNYVFCSDGSLPWPLLEKYDSDKVENIVRTIDDQLVPLKDIDGNALLLLKEITEFYVRNGTTVKYLLVPVHPYSFSKWKSENDSRGFIQAEKTYRSFAKSNGITIVGSYDPSIIGCKNTDFRDWVHPLPRCTNLLAQSLRHGHPALTSID